METQTLATEPDLLQTAMTLIAERGYAAYSRTELARAAGVPLTTVYAELPDRAALLRALGARLDRAMLGVEPGELDGMTARERLFELIMRRLDAMAPFKEGLKVMGREAQADLEVIMTTMANLGRATGWLLDAAGTGLTGWRKGLGAQLLAALYVRVFNVWLKDDSPEMATTLAELDRRLNQLDRLASWSGPRPATDTGAEPGPAPAPA